MIRKRKIRVRDTTKILSKEIVYSTEWMSDMPFINLNEIKHSLQELIFFLKKYMLKIIGKVECHEHGAITGWQIIYKSVYLELRT